MASLDQVKNEKMAELESQKREKVEQYHQKLKAVLQNKSIPLPALSTFRPNPQIPVSLTEDSQSAFKDGSKSFNIADLSWADKERVLRLLFAKMNGAEIQKPKPSKHKVPGNLKKKVLRQLKEDDPPLPEANKLPDLVPINAVSS
jgi:hypothetical protein